MSMIVNVAIDYMPELTKLNAILGWALIGVLGWLVVATIWEMVQEREEERRQLRAACHKYRRANHGKE